MNGLGKKKSNEKRKTKKISQSPNSNGEAKSGVLITEPPVKKREEKMTQN
jgi:hypothetical protein